MVCGLEVAGPKVTTILAFLWRRIGGHYSLSMTGANSCFDKRGHLKPTGEAGYSEGGERRLNRYSEGGEKRLN